MILRIFVGVVCMFSALFAPWWVTAVIILFPLFYFKLYIEGVVIGFLYDTLFAVEVSYLYSFEFVATLYTLFFFLLFSFLKKRLFWTQEWQ